MNASFVSIQYARRLLSSELSSCIAKDRQYDNLFGLWLLQLVIEERALTKNGTKVPLVALYIEINYNVYGH